MLKRDISTTNVLIAAAGGMIGSGWLFSPYISAQIAGAMPWSVGLLPLFLWFSSPYRSVNWVRCFPFQEG